LLFLPRWDKKCGISFQKWVIMRENYGSGSTFEGFWREVMSENQSFAEFMRRIRAGDEEAAAELVRLYEPAVRLEVRLRLGEPGLRRVFDSMDICQSVMASFFVRAASGQYELNNSKSLLKLLVAMARNKLAFQVRKQHAQSRDNRRTRSGTQLTDTVADSLTPDRVVSGRELLRNFRERLSAEERQLADLRSQGCEWAEVANQLGGSPQARRKQLARAVERVTAELGLD
jgi:RNA polymerase sigma-70 factor (ECF subfamily)